MIRIIVDANMRSQLHNLTEPAEICDASGKVLGRFSPCIASAPIPLPELVLSEEELRRISLEPDFTTAEVLAHLESL